MTLKEERGKSSAADTQTGQAAADLLHALAKQALAVSQPAENLLRTRDPSAIRNLRESVELLSFVRGDQNCLVLLEAHGLDHSAEKLGALATELARQGGVQPLILLEGNPARANFLDINLNPTAPVPRALAEFGLAVAAPVHWESVPNVASADVQQRMFTQVESNSTGRWRQEHVLGWLAGASGMRPDQLDFVIGFLKQHGNFERSESVTRYREFLALDGTAQQRMAEQITLATDSFVQLTGRGANFSNPNDYRKVVEFGRDINPDFEDQFSLFTVVEFLANERLLLQFYRLIEMCQTSARTADDILESLEMVNSLAPEERYSLAQDMNSLKDKMQDQAAVEVLSERIKLHPLHSPLIICAGYRHKPGIVDALISSGFQDVARSL